MGSESIVLVMGGCLHLVAAVAVLAGAQAQDAGNKTGRAFSLFSIVQFPNAGCTGSSSSTTFGTCYTATECSAAGGSADGNRAAGFGVCCLITTNTCGSTISTNTTYIRNSGYRITHLFKLSFLNFTFLATPVPTPHPPPAVVHSP